MFAKRTAIIVDQMAFRRARVERFLEAWAEAETIELISVQYAPALVRLAEGGCDILIYNVGAAPCAHEILAEIQTLHRLCPRAALVILSDDASPLSISTAFDSGARGYLSDSMHPQLALHALSFILHGGTYFPPSAMLPPGKPTGVSASPSIEESCAGRQMNAVPQRQHISCQGPDEDVFHGQRSAAETTCYYSLQFESVSSIQGNSAASDGLKFQLTSRQSAILHGICRGDSNKIIARAFDIAESTVKIHVKTILRKIAVKNRTQAAIWAIQNGLYSPSEEPVAVPRARSPSLAPPQSEGR